MFCLILILFLMIMLCFFYLSNKKMKTELHCLSRKISDLNDEKNSYIREIGYLNWNNKIKEISFYNSCNKKYIPNKELKVLVADYYVASANITASVLQNIGVYAEFVSSGEDIIDRIKKNNGYDIIITNNILCGKLDGYQTLLELKNMENFSTPVVILTVSCGCFDYFVKECGFDGYIEKTLTVEKAMNTFTSLIPNLKFNKSGKDNY